MLLISPSGHTKVRYRLNATRAHVIREEYQRDDTTRDNWQRIPNREMTVADSARQEAANVANGWRIIPDIS